MSTEPIDLFKELTSIKNLKIGWHLTQKNLRNNYVESYLEANIFKTNLQQNLEEIRKRIVNEDYKFHDLIRIEVPKKGLGVRPGSVITLQDCVVLNTIIYLICVKLNNNLSSSVYSYRLKDKVKNKIAKGAKVDCLFKEAKAFDVPFLRNKTVSENYTFYNDWYVTWLEFDRDTKKIISENKYKYMATSDISAYFENIQLPILKNQLLKVFNKNHKIINFLFQSLSFWTIRTNDGIILHRGLPQGDLIFSFLGNYFLHPIDVLFDSHPRKEEFKYFRYMDDIKIFSNSESLCRELLLELNRNLRELHLNTQSAKTKIYNQNYKKQVSEELIDSRLEELENFKERELDNIKNNDINDLIKRLEDIVLRKENGKSIKNNKRALEGLEFRLFSRYITLSCDLKNSKCINKYFSELSKNPDIRLLQKSIRITSCFPSHYITIEKRIIDFIDSNMSILPYQKALCIHALRYLNKLSDDTKKRMISYVKNTKEDFYIRIQASFLLNSFVLTGNELNEIEKIWENENNIWVQRSLSFILSQKHDMKDVINKLLLYPNKHINTIGVFFNKMQNDIYEAKSLMDYVFTANNHQKIIDNIAVLQVISKSENIEILEMMKKHTMCKERNKINNVLIRNHIKSINIKITEKIKEAS